MHWTIAVRLTLGLLLIAFLLCKFDPFAILSSILHANPMFLLLDMAVYSITFLRLSFRWKRILWALGEDLPFIVAYQAFAGGVLFSDMTPGKIGDLSRPLLVKDRLALNKGFASVIIDRYTDLLTTSFLGLAGMLLLTHAGLCNLLA
jgi:uncharacterized protein (TIRG00374 family)